MKVKDKLLEIPKNTFIKIVGNKWDIGVKSPDKEFKHTFRDVLEKEIKSVDNNNKLGMVIIYV